MLEGFSVEATLPETVRLPLVERLEPDIASPDIVPVVEMFDADSVPFMVVLPFLYTIKASLLLLPHPGVPVPSPLSITSAILSPVPLPITKSLSFSFQAQVDSGVYSVL